MITIHHLDRSRSERPVWLMEELQEPYEIRHYRRLETWEAEPAYKRLHPLGSSPVIADGDVLLTESGAVVEYLASRLGGGRLKVAVDEENYADYLFWFHFAESSLMPQLTQEIMSEMGGVPFDNPGRVFSRHQAAKYLRFVDERLASVPYFAGKMFTAADIMMAFTFTTPLMFTPVDLDPFPNIVRYMDRIRERSAYQRCQAIAGPGNGLDE